MMKHKRTSSRSYLIVDHGLVQGGYISYSSDASSLHWTCMRLSQYNVWRVRSHRTEFRFTLGVKSSHMTTLSLVKGETTAKTNGPVDYLNSGCMHKNSPRGTNYTYYNVRVCSGYLLNESPLLMNRAISRTSILTKLQVLLE